MKSLRMNSAIGGIALYFICHTIYAEQDAQPAVPAMEQHGKHEHGIATLSIAISDDGAELLLDSPAINIVGFEHMPASDDDKEHLDDIVKKLEKGNDLFTLTPEAGCELKDTEVLSGLLGDELETSAPQTAEASATTGQTPSAEHDHQDMEVTWAYACSNPEQLKDIQTTLFSVFPDGLQRLHIEWVTPSGASASELEQDGNIKLE